MPNSHQRQSASQAPLPPHPKKDNSSRIMLWSLLAIAIVVACGLLLPSLIGGAHVDALIRIPAGATSAQVQDSIAKYLGDTYAKQTMRFFNVTGTDPERRHGAYIIKKGMSPTRAAAVLIRGGQQPVRVTVNSQRALRQVAADMAARLDFAPDSLFEAATDSVFLAAHGLRPEQAMALWLDDTYEVYWSASPQQLLDKVAANYDRLWDESRTTKARAMGYEPWQVMTICSIVDEETLKDDEKGRVGRLYMNRLERGMKLQADPTVRYAMNDFTIRRVQGVHLKADSPYNTYLHAGLPPGPIRTGRAKTVDLVLNAPATDALYMCARSDFSGYHDFAATYPEHQANARRYQQALDARGIK